MDKSKLQEIFDKAYVGVVKQEGIAFDVSTGKCTYYVEADGCVNKCAVGHLISDDVLKTVDNFGFGVGAMEAINGAMWENMIRGNNIRPEDAEEVVNFLSSIQYIHDTCTPQDLLVDGVKPTPDMMKDFRDKFTLRMKRLAHDHDLEWKH